MIQILNAKSTCTKNFLGLAGAATLLVAFAGISLGCGNEPDKIEIVGDAERGESCQRPTECKDKLTCVNNTCIKNEYSISTTDNMCRRIECTEDSECCDDDVENCDQLCQDGTCVQDRSCDNDDDCGVGGTCSNGECVQCESDDDCSDGMACKSGVCQEVCEIDENCPLFHDCSDGDCVRNGCESDRECILASNDADATCKNSNCQIPCQNDAECNRGSSGNFRVCENGACKFIGCKTDRECRIALGLQNTEGVQASCTSGSSDGGG